MKQDTSGLVEKWVSCGARRPGFKSRWEQYCFGFVRSGFGDGEIGGWWDWKYNRGITWRFLSFFYSKYQKWWLKITTLLKAFPAYCDLFSSSVLHDFCMNFCFLRSSMPWSPRMLTKAAMMSLKVRAYSISRSKNSYKNCANPRSKRYCNKQEKLLVM